MKVFDNKIKIIDLFAGPGGLGEGFSAYKTADGKNTFRIALSVEKDHHAHQTLTLRSFYQQFEADSVPDEYYKYFSNADEPEAKKRDRLFNQYPNAARAATEKAVMAELGKVDIRIIRDQINMALDGRSEFVLIGGPPCQPYSIIGRSRNVGNPKYSKGEDKRQTLYIEYLQVLADHRPAVFVMENVKGLLSATLDNQLIFERILEDLRSPCEAILREGRLLADARRRTRYTIRSLVRTENGDTEDLRRFIVKMERYGIPQARHRLIIVGIRNDLGIRHISPLCEAKAVSAGEVLTELPKVRSGLSNEEDTFNAWCERIRQIRALPFMSWQADFQESAIKNEINNALDSLSTAQLSRGGEFVSCRPIVNYRPDWFIDPKMDGVFNHATRSHISSDLHRYLFAACYSAIRKRSPKLKDFPQELLPNHKNAERSATDGTFDDRFHTQLPDRPATTVTSHLAKDGHYFIHPDPCQCRSMTVREVARLQTFPDNYYFCGPRSAQYNQVGNAVPPLLANQIAESIFRLLSECGLSE